MKMTFVLCLLLAAALAMPTMPSLSQGLTYIEAPQLTKDYATNAQAADKKYRGRGSIGISGIVEAVAKKQSGLTQILLKGHNKSSFVCLNINGKNDEEIAAQVEKEQAILITCNDVELGSGFVQATGCQNLEVWEGD